VGRALGVVMHPVFGLYGSALVVRISRVRVCVEGREVAAGNVNPDPMPFANRLLVGGMSMVMG